MKVLAVIPARYASTRFPGKPLAQLGGESIVSRVWRRVSQTDGIDAAVVATDDERIRTHMEAVSGPDGVMMTSEKHRSGTDRCGEVLQRLESQGHRYDIVINVQGDEPFVEPAQLQALIGCFDDPAVLIATLRTPIRSTEELFSPDNVKVVCADGGRALYFSRQPIPYRRGIEPAQWLAQGGYYKHVGIYAFRAATLHELCRLQPAALEEAEKLEQLRWLAAGYTLLVGETSHANIGIDTPGDLAAAEEYLRNNQ